VSRVDGVEQIMIDAVQIEFSGADRPEADALSAPLGVDA
jgi:hypothetical protein